VRQDHLLAPVAHARALLLEQRLARPRRGPGPTRPPPRGRAVRQVPAGRSRLRPNRG
jgi:hypothetical protein